PRRSSDLRSYWRPRRRSLRTGSGRSTKETPPPASSHSTADTQRFAARRRRQLLHSHAAPHAAQALPATPRALSRASSHVAIRFLECDEKRTRPHATIGRADSPRYALPPRACGRRRAPDRSRSASLDREARLALALPTPAARPNRAPCSSRRLRSRPHDTVSMHDHRVAWTFRSAPEPRENSLLLHMPPCLPQVQATRSASWQLPRGSSSRHRLRPHTSLSD